MLRTQMSCQIQSIDNAQNGMLECTRISPFVKRISFRRSGIPARYERRFTIHGGLGYGYDGTCGAD